MTTISFLFGDPITPKHLSVQSHLVAGKRNKRKWGGGKVREGRKGQRNDRLEGLASQHWKEGSKEKWQKKRVESMKLESKRERSTFCDMLRLWKTHEGEEGQNGQQVIFSLRV